MSDPWKSRLINITGTAPDGLEDAPRELLYKGHVYKKQDPTVDSYTYKAPAEIVEYTLAEYREDVLLDALDAAFSLRLTPVAPGSVKVFYMNWLVAKDDSMGRIISCGGLSLREGYVYYNDGSVTLVFGNLPKNGPLTFQYKRLEVKQYYNKTARGGSIASVSEFEINEK